MSSLDKSRGLGFDQKGSMDGGESKGGRKGSEAEDNEVNVATLKRTRDDFDNDDDCDFTPDELSKMSRSERKRHREKKRRSDVNKGFDELMALLLEIEPEVRKEAEEKARRGQWKGSLGAHEDNLLSRVDLIGRTVNVLRRIHNENEQRKQIIEDLTKGMASNSYKPNEVSFFANIHRYTRLSLVHTNPTFSKTS
jgi:hypothetical protein